MTIVLVTALKVDRFGKVRFGTLTRDGRQCVVVPRFTAGTCTREHVMQVNKASPLRVTNMTEDQLMEAMSQAMGGKSPPRVLEEDGIFTALDQEAASKLIQMGFKRLEKAKIIPI